MPDLCPTPPCQTRTRMEAALQARSAALNAAGASTTPMADVWRCSVSSLFLRILLGSAFRLHEHTHSDTDMQTPNTLLRHSICSTYISTRKHTLDPYKCTCTTHSHWTETSDIPCTRVASKETKTQLTDAQRFTC